MKDLVINKRITNEEEAINNSDKVLQDLCDKSGAAGMCVKQSFGLTWYWNNHDDNYYFQIIGKQYGETWSSFYGGGISIFIGNGIRLYNDDNYAYFSTIESKNKNLKFLRQYPETAYSKVNLNFNFKKHLSKFKKGIKLLNKITYVTLKNFLNK